MSLYKNVQTLALGYYNQDYDLINGSSAEVLLAFKRDSTEAELLQFLDELEAMVAVSDEVELAAIWLDQMLSAYDPRSDGYTFRQWFDYVRDVMTTP